MPVVSAQAGSPHEEDSRVVGASLGAVPGHGRVIFSDPNTMKALTVRDPDAARDDARTPLFSDAN